MTAAIEGLLLMKRMRAPRSGEMVDFDLPSKEL